MKDLFNLFHYSRSNHTNLYMIETKFQKEDLEQLNFRSNNINLNDALDHLDPLAPGGGRGGPMDGPWGGAGGAGPLGPQRRGPPPGPVDDHFDLGLGVGPGPMGMGPPPQPRGGFPPNPSGFSGANSIMNNVGNAGATINQGILARLLNSQQQPNNQPHFNPVSYPHKRFAWLSAI